MSVLHTIVLLVAAQRVIEVAYARRNERRLRAAGGIEVGRRHYPLFFLLHGAWLLALLIFAPPDAPIYWPLLILFAGLQVARLWVIATLGPAWTTRIITVPGAPLITRGPYRWTRHPNYLIVAAEIAVLPLAFGAWAIAGVFSIANALLLAHRIRTEDRALAPRRRRPADAPLSPDERAI
jgi:methyltransferase